MQSLQPLAQTQVVLSFDFLYINVNTMTATGKLEIPRPQPEEAVMRTHVIMTLIVNLAGYRTA